jgi:hypothetical protein
MLGIAATALLAACGSTTPGSAAVEAVASPGEALGAFPGVEGFSYRLQTDVGGFLLGVQDTLGDQVDVEIGQAAVATRGEDEVSLVAFGFPGTTDTQAVDFFARVLDDMEDGFQAASQRGLGGDAYLMRANGQTVVLAPWGRTEHLIFLFALGPEGTTEELAAALLDAGS